MEEIGSFDPISPVAYYRAFPRVLTEAARLVDKKEGDEMLIAVSISPTTVVAAIVALSRFALALADNNPERAREMLLIYADHAKKALDHMIEEEEKRDG